MTKRLVIACLLLLSVAGVKAQTYCYHCYKSVYKTNSGYQYCQEDSYRYFTFQGDFLFDYSHPDKPNSKDKTAWKYTGLRHDGHLMYSKYYRNAFGNYNDLVEYTNKDYYENYYVSDNRNLIRYNSGDDVYYYYERCSDRNCR